MTRGVKDVVTQFLDVTLNMTGTDESKVNDILKKVHDNKANAKFERKIIKDLGKARAKELLDEYKSNSIVQAILKDELSGATLRRAQNLYTVGCDKDEPTNSELFLEGAMDVFDLSGVGMKVGYGVGAAGVVGAIFFGAPVILVGAIVVGGMAILATGNGIVNAARNNKCFCEIPELEDSNVSKDGVVKQAQDGQTVVNNKKADPMAEKFKMLFQAMEHAKNLQQIKHNGIFYTVDECFDNIVGDNLPDSEIDTMVALNELAECENEIDSNLSEYYSGIYNSMFYGENLSEADLANRFLELARRFSEDGTNVGKALDQYSESVNYTPDNDVVAEGIVYGVAEGALDETNGFIKNAFDALVHDFKEGDYDHSMNINASMLGTQKFVSQQYKDETDPVRKHEINEFYEDLIQSKHDLLCDRGKDGAYQYRENYCTYLNDFIEEYKSPDDDMLAPKEGQ